MGVPVPAYRALTLAFAFTRVTSSPHNLPAVVLVGAVIRKSTWAQAGTAVTRLPAELAHLLAGSLPMPEVPLQRLAQSSRLCLDAFRDGDCVASGCVLPLKSSLLTPVSECYTNK